MCNGGRQLTKHVNFEFELSIDDEGDDYAVIYARRISEGDNPPRCNIQHSRLGAELENLLRHYRKGKIRVRTSW